MTEQFYVTLLGYISQKEKQKLCDHLKKSRITVNGFRLGKDTPTHLLASSLANQERAFLKVLRENYDFSIADNSEIPTIISPDNALGCLVSLLRSNDFDEQWFSSFLEPPEDHIKMDKEETKSLKSQKKADEFRRKYLSAYKENAQLKKRIQEVENENEALRVRINSQAQQLQAANDRFEQKIFAYEERIGVLRRKVSELEEQFQQTPDSQAYVGTCFVITNCSLSQYPNVCVIRPDEKDIWKIAEETIEISEVLLVDNSLTFSAKRILNKITKIKGKIHSFPSIFEMEQYIEKRGKV